MADYLMPVNRGGPSERELRAQRALTGLPEFVPSRPISEFLPSQVVSPADPLASTAARANAAAMTGVTVAGGEGYPTIDVPKFEALAPPGKVASPGMVSPAAAQQPVAAQAFRDLFAGLTAAQVKDFMASATAKEKPMSGRDIGSREYMSIVKSEYLAALGAAAQEKDPKKRQQLETQARGVLTQKLLPTFMGNPTNQAVAETF